MNTRQVRPLKASVGGRLRARLRPEVSPLERRMLLSLGSEVSSTATGAAPLRVVLISDAVSQADPIAAAAQPGVIVSRYDGATGGVHALVSQLAAISRANGGAPIGQLALVAHGGEGSVAVSDRERWTLDTLPLLAADWGRLRALLTSDAQLDLYSCDVAAGPDGREFVRQLAAWTGADVFASDDPVGSGNAGDFAWEYGSSPVRQSREPLDPGRLEQIVGLRLDDSYEDNDTKIIVDGRPPGAANSPNFGPLTGVKTVAGLALEDKADWYKFQTGGVGTTDDYVQLTFDWHQGDVDLYVYRASGDTLVGADTGNNDYYGYNDARVSLRGELAGTFYVVVVANSTAAGNPPGIADYSLTISAPAVAGDDPYEDNDTKAAVDDMTPGEAYSPSLGLVSGVRGISALTLGDSADWYKFHTAEVGTADHYVRLTFDWHQGDVDLYVYSANGSTLVGADTGNNDYYGYNDAEVSMDGQPAGTYYVRVIANSTAAGNPPGIAGYDLEISAPIVPNPGTIQFDAYNFDVVEGMGVAAVTVSRAGGDLGSVSVNYTTSNGTAVAPGDYAATSGTLTWADGVSGPKTILIPIVDDGVQEPDETVLVRLSNPTGGAVIAAIASTTLMITNDDIAGFTITPVNNRTTTEAGGKTTFTVRLNTQPSADVKISLTSSDTTEGIVFPTSLTFTPDNWNVAQTVTVTGVDDFVDDGDVAYTIVTAPATSTDENYSGLNPADVSATNVDDDTAGITVAPTTILTTTEAGGGATFTVRLNSQPTADVMITLSSGDATEGAVGPVTLTFTPANWNIAQTVAVAGVDDLVDDGDVAYTIVTAPAVSADPKYNGLDASDVQVINLDDDTIGITITPTSGLTTTEAGGKATFAVKLASQPTANVAISLSSSNTAEGTVGPTPLIFTPSNWKIAQTVTVTGVDDFVIDGNVPYVIVTAPAASADPKYNGLNPADVSVTNINTTTASIVVAPTTGLTTTEAGGKATFTVRLGSRPAANVTISLSSSDTTEGTVSPAALTFTPANWNAAQTVTVTGVQDSLDDGDVAYAIVTAPATSTDGNYSGLNPADVSATNVDDDTAGFVIAPISGPTTEAGGKATFTVRLGSQPTANVTIGLSSGDATEGTVSPASLTFTPGNWGVAQTVTVTGVDDLVDDGDVAYAIVTAGAASADAKYNGLNPADVPATNVDNDTAGITVAPTSGLTTTEAGGKATLTVKLNSQPTANVTIGLSSSDPSEGTVSPPGLTFTTANWNVAQTVTVTGVDDFVVDGHIGYTIVTAPAASADAKYAGLNAADVTATNTDDDVIGFIITPASGLVTTEAGGTATFTVRLGSLPSNNVFLGLSSSDPSEGTVSPPGLTFTTANWNVPQVVQVTGVDDLVDDGDIPYAIVTAPAVSADAQYGGLNAPDVAVTNVDNDTAGFVITPVAGLTTTEAGGKATFTVKLSSLPTANVTLGLSSSDATEGTVSPASLTFTPANWNAAQTVTVTGVDDLVDDGDVAYAVVTAPAASADAKYGGLNPADVSATNVDDDTAGFVIAPISGPTTEAGGKATFTVRLGSQPTANVTIGLSSGDATEGTVSPPTLTFTSANWNAARTVTITGVDDLVDDGDIAYAIVTAAAASADGKYAGLNPADVQAVNADNDTAAVVIAPTGGSTVVAEGGFTDTYTVRLASQPTAPVTITLTADAQVTAAPATLTFTPDNWNVPQSVTITAVADRLVEGNHTGTIAHKVASADPVYNNIAVPNVVAQILDKAPSTASDYDGDGKMDPAVFEPSTSTFYLARSTAGNSIKQFGIGTLYGGRPIPVPGDYDGDGKTDPAVFEPSTSTFFLAMSTAGNKVVQFGIGSLYGGDPTPVPGDYDGDGKTDPAVFEPSTSTFYLARSTAGNAVKQFGIGTLYGGLPTVAPADYDADGKMDPAVFEPSTSTFYLARSTAGNVPVQFGIGSLYGGNPTPVPADYDADGKADPAVFEPSTSTFYLARSTAGNAPVQFGIGSLYGGRPTPVPADYDGDGKADPAVFEPSTSTFYLARSTAGNAVKQFGIGSLYGGLPTVVPADYDGDGKMDPAVFEPSTSTFYLARSTAGNAVKQFGIGTLYGGRPVPLPQPLHLMFPSRRPRR